MAENKVPKKEERSEKTLGEILQIINRRKSILIISVFITLILAGVYSFTVKPVYESTVVLKKEKTPDSKSPTDLLNIVNFQSPDEVETEMELVKTWTVLSKVVDNLNLNLEVGKIELPSGKKILINKSLVDYYNPEYFNNPPKGVSFPQFVDVKVKDKDAAANLYIEVNKNNLYSIYNAENDSLLSRNSAESSAGVFNLDGFDIIVYWPNTLAGSKIYFTINNYYQTISALRDRISLDNKVKTNIFTISVKDNSPYAAALIANTVTEKFRDSRIEQQKQTIKYSFDFVDKQLEEMQEKLKEAEKNLSDFKASGQIMTIDASSTELVRYMSDLEAAKMQTELQLTDYKNKLDDMKKQLQSGGYFDQSLLTPDRGDVNGSPFAALMKQLSDLELQRLDLLQKRTENHPDVQAVDEQIKMVKQKLGSYNQNTLTAYQIMINSLDKKLLQITNMMSKYEVKMERLPGQENKLAGLMRQKTVYEKIFTMLLDKREEMRMAELSKLQDIIVVDQAQEPIDPIAPKKSFNMAAGLLVGLFTGLFLIFIVELKNNKLVNLDEIERDFELPVMAIIPSYPKSIKEKINDPDDIQNQFVTLMDRQDGLKETFRLLKTKLSFQFDDKVKTIMVTSCEENTGKTTIVSNLGLSIAQEKKRVLIIDCDLKKGTLSSQFGISLKAPGLIDYLIGKDVKPFIHKNTIGKVDILSSGGTREDSSELLNSERMSALFDLINTSYYHFIIIDTPPVTRVVDTLVLGKWVNNALLVVRPGHSFKEGVQWGIHEMNRANIKIAGIVVNAAEIKESSYRYRYGYGYGYGYGNSKDIENTNGKAKSDKISEKIISN